MNTNIKIELTDEQRVTLQEQLTGRKRPISRVEVTEFVLGCIQGALCCEQVYEKRGNVQADLGTEPAKMPETWAEQYRDKTDHWKQGWLRGWAAVGSRLG